MTDITVPQGFTECERYGGAIIASKRATYSGFGLVYYRGFAPAFETQLYSAKADCRGAIDRCNREQARLSL